MPGRPPKAVAELGAAPRRRDDGMRSPAQKVDMALANLNTARHWLEDASRDLRQGRDASVKPVVSHAKLQLSTWNSSDSSP